MQWKETNLGGVIFGFTEEANMFTGFKYNARWVSKQQDTNFHCCVFFPTVMAKPWP